MRIGTLAVLGLIFASCASSAAGPAATTRAGFRPTVRLAVATPAPEPRAASVVVVTLDGTRWQDVFAAEDTMPTLHRWMTTDGVALGAPGHGQVRASGPNYVSLPGYTEIFTGRPSDCQSNDCAPIAERTIVDEVLDSGEGAAVVTSWERIARAATANPARVLLSCGRHETGQTAGLDAKLLAADRDVAPWPGSDDYRPDALTARVALRLVEKSQPRFLFVGLGDTDEHAHHGDRAAYLAAMRSADRFLAQLEERVVPGTVVFVTADHGRSAAFRDHGAAWPESGRVWLVARGDTVPARGTIDTGVLHLADIAPTVRCLLGMPRDESERAGESIAAICDPD